MTESYEIMASVIPGRPPHKVKIEVATINQASPPAHPSQSAALVNLGCRHRGAQLPGAIFPPPDGLGDAISNALSAIGVTKEWWAEQKAKFISSVDANDCSGCKYRQAFLNWVGSKLPGGFEGKGATVQKVMELEGLPPQPVYECASHGRCLPHLNVTQESRDRLAHVGWRGCAGCPDMELVTLETGK